MRYGPGDGPLFIQERARVGPPKRWEPMHVRDPGEALRSSGLPGHDQNV